MKRCPKCNTTYTDASFNYCLVDGVNLVSVGASPYADTIVGKPVPPAGRFSDIKTAGFILDKADKSIVGAKAGDTLFFNGYFVNLNDTEIIINGYGAGILTPRGLHGSAMPFRFNPSLPHKLAAGSVLGPSELFSLSIPESALKPEDKTVTGFVQVAYKEYDEPNDRYYGGMPTLFHVNLIDRIA